MRVRAVLLLGRTQLSTMGALDIVAGKLSKARDMEVVSARERVTEGIRLYVRYRDVTTINNRYAPFVDLSVFLNFCRGNVVCCRALGVDMLLHGMKRYLQLS